MGEMGLPGITVEGLFAEGCWSRSTSAPVPPLLRPRIHRSAGLCGGGMEWKRRAPAIRKAAGFMPRRLEADFADGETGVIAGQFFVRPDIAQRPAGNIGCEIDVRHIRMIHETRFVRVEDDLRRVERIDVAVALHEFPDVIGR